ncbi:MAG: alpha/beta hydrolase [Gammaproteobacteria bacterium]|nr:alpha/beta hydrolase [Gammaproteobacteria bacterium]
MTFTSNNKQTFLIPGPAGAVEVLISSPAEPRAITCIVCHPHPVQGGTMHNKVVYTLSSTMEALGIKTVRFNFRGVQKSEGEFGHGVGELADLEAVLEWVRAQCPNDDIWLAGFSFGAFIAIKGNQICNAQVLVAVAPPVGHPYFNELPQITCPWILVQGEQDEIVDAKTVLEWAEQQVPAPEVIAMPDAGHFFHGQLVVLKERLLSLLPPLVLQ